MFDIGSIVLFLENLDFHLDANKFPASGDKPPAQTKVECSNFQNCIKLSCFIKN
jgi:hypothetical protein